MKSLGIGIVGGGYMGKRHAVAFQAVAATFHTALRPRLEMVCARTMESAGRYQADYGFARATDDWQKLVADDQVDAVIIASTQDTHEPIALAAAKAGKAVFCEKPLSTSVASGERMVAAAKAAGIANMIGFNYIRTPASQLARQLVARGDLGDVTYFRGEHTEDFYADPKEPASWRTTGEASGTMGDLAPHMINAALAIAGPIRSLMAEVETVHTTRPSPDGPQAVTNDDQAQMMCRFENGAMGHMFFSRIATGRKMGYIYEINGTKGAIRFDQEDQNALWYYDMNDRPELRGFRKILTGPAHPDYGAFCDGPGHGTGYQDQIIIEARDFLEAIESGKPVWPTFEDGLIVDRLVEAARHSSNTKSWVEIP